MALQPRATLVPDSSPNPLPPTGEVEDSPSPERSRGKNRQKYFSQFRPRPTPDKPTQSAKVSARVDWKTRPGCLHRPFPGLKTCRLQGSPQSHLLSSSKGAIWITNQGSPKGKCPTLEWLCPCPQGPGGCPSLTPMTFPGLPGPSLAFPFLGLPFLNTQAGLPAVTHTQKDHGVWAGRLEGGKV